MLSIRGEGEVGQGLIVIAYMGMGSAVLGDGVPSPNSVSPLFCLAVLMAKLWDSLLQPVTMPLVSPSRGLHDNTDLLTCFDVSRQRTLKAARDRY